MNRSLTDRTLSSLAWQAFSKLFEVFGRIVVLAALARMLAPQDFGVASASLVILAFSQTITQLGVAPALVQRAEISDRHVSSAFGISLLMGTLGGITVFAAAGAISDLFRMAALEPVAKAVALCFPLAAPGMVAEALLSRRLAFRKLALAETFSFAVGYGAVAISLAAVGWGVWALVIGQLSQVALKSTLVLVASRSSLSVRTGIKESRELLRFGFGHSLAELGNFAALQGDNIIVGRYLGPNDLGLYSRAYTLLAQPARLVGMVFDKVLFPAMSQVQDDPVRLGRAAARAHCVIAVVSVPLSILLVITAPEIVRILFGAGWEGAIVPFQILASTLFFRTAYKISDAVVRAKGASLRRAIRQWIYAIAVLGFGFTGAQYGIPGVAIGVATAILLNFFLMTQLSLRIIGMRWAILAPSYLSVLLINAPASVAAASAAHLSRQVNFPPIITVLLAGFTFFAIAALFALTTAKLMDPNIAWMRGILLGRLSRAVQRFRK